MGFYKDFVGKQRKIDYTNRSQIVERGENEE